ncbi:MAG: tetratricopeptide repeat protein, partial [Ignavibacteriaceae bacterium]|nr:tetratricopeptide repeat protein [Ignavibacteriaceae bacterium]
NKNILPVVIRLFIILIFTILLIPTPLIAQSLNEEIKLLEAQVVNQTGLEQIESMKELSWLYLTVNSKKSLQIAQDGLEKLKNYQDPKLKATLLNISGRSLTYTGYYNIALEKHLESLQLREEFDDSIAIASSLNNIGLIYTHLDKTREAISYFNKALEYKYKIGEKGAIIVSLNNLGEAYIKIRKYDKASTLLKKALSLSKEENNVENLALTFSNLGKLFVEEDIFDSALIFAKNSLELRKKLDDNLGQGEQHLELGKIYMRAKEYKFAENNLLEARKIAAKFSFYPLLRDAYFELYLLSSKRHEDKKKFYNYIKFVAINEKINSESVKKELEELNLKYDQEKNVTKIRQLEIDKQSTFLLYMIVIGFILIIAWGIILNRYRTAKKLNNALAEREQFNKALIARLPEYVLVHSEGKIVFTNKILREVFGVAEDNYENISMLNFISNEYKSKVIRNMLRRGKGEDVEDYEAEILDKDGKVRNVIIKAANIPYQDKTAILVVMNDITARKQAEVEIIEAKEQAEKSDRLKSEFLASVSHEIRTPLHVMLSWVSLLHEDVEDKITPDLLEGFNIVKNQGARTIRTIDLILNMSEMQLGTYEVVPREIDLHKDILLKLYSELSSRAKNKKLSFNLFVQTVHSSIIVDEYSVYQIFSNIIENAIKYTENGNVNILIGRDVVDNLFVSVSDTGIGISDEYLQNIFKPFSQEQQGYSRKFEGNGLGLALVKKYCELNNADIKVESEKEKGTEITVTFYSKNE